MEEEFPKIREMLSREVQTARELSSLAHREVRGSERKLVDSQMKNLKKSLRRHSKEIPKRLEKIPMTKSLPTQSTNIAYNKSPKTNVATEGKKIQESLTDIEKQTLKRLLKKEKKVEEKKEIKPSSYVKFANRLFSDTSIKILRKGHFRSLKRDLIRANMQILPKSYVSIIFLTTIISVFVAFLAFVFFLFFNVGPALPIITMAQENILP